MNKCIYKSITKAKNRLIAFKHKEISKRQRGGSTVTINTENTEKQILYLLDQICDDSLINHPPVLFAHQLNSIMNIDEVNDHIGCLMREGKVAKIKLPSVRPSVGILHIERFKSWFIKNRGRDPRMFKFVKELLPKIKMERCEKTLLTQKFRLTPRDIKDLVNTGLLVAGQDSSTYELSFPGAGTFCKSFLMGRQAIVSTLLRTPDKELLYHDLEGRGSVLNGVSLGFKFQMADVLGLGIADGIETTGGLLIRFLKDYP